MMTRPPSKPVPPRTRKGVEMKTLIAALVVAWCLGGCATIGALQTRIAALEKELAGARSWEGRASTTPPPRSLTPFPGDGGGDASPIPMEALYASAPWSEQGVVYLDRMPPGRTEREVIRFSSYMTRTGGPLLVMLGDDLPPVPVDWRAPPSTIHLPGGSITRLPLIPNGSTGYVLPDVVWTAAAITIVRFRGDPWRGFVVDCVSRRGGARIARPWGQLFTDTGCSTNPVAVRAVEEQLLRLRVPGT